MLRPCQPSDAQQICAIYNHYVRETVVTFEEAPVAAHDMAQRIVDVTQRHPWIVWEEDGALQGYAYAAAWKTRSAYRHSVESTVYLAPSATGRGLGTRLYEALIADLHERDTHCVVGGISLPNAASVALHEKLGFKRIGQFSEIGRKFGQWIDVGYWQLVI